MNISRKILLFFSTLLFLAGGFWFFNSQKAEAPVEGEKKEIISGEKRETVAEEKEENDKSGEVEPEEEKAPKSEIEIPEKFFIDVPFTSQAPFAKWDETHEETCEEASLLMVKYYLDGKKLTPQSAEKELLALVEFQNEKRGDFKDTDAQETADLGEDFYGISNFRVVYDFSKEELKKELAQGKPVIVPTAGRRLGNPNFTPPGPLYHMLVLTGYDGNVIITNDPGTRKGENYRYDLNVLYAAIHDFPGRPEDVEKGRKAMIVLD